MKPQHHPTHSNVRFPIQPRLVPAAKVARWLHLTHPEFLEALPALQNAGFPKPCPITGHYDLMALEAWQDRRSGLIEKATYPADTDSLIRERLANLG